MVELAVPLLQDAAGAPVEAIIGVPSPLEAIHDAVNLHGADEIIISTLPARVSKWLKLDLPSKVGGPGAPGDDDHRARARAVDRVAPRGGRRAGTRAAVAGRAAARALA